MIYNEATNAKTIDNTVIGDYFINNDVVWDSEYPFGLKFGSKMYIDKN